MSFRSCIEQLILFFPPHEPRCYQPHQVARGTWEEVHHFCFPDPKITSPVSVSFTHSLPHLLRHVYLFHTSRVFSFTCFYSIFFCSFFLSYLSVPLFYRAPSLFLYTDFDFSVPGSMKLHNLISKLKKWIKILEAKTKQLPKFFLIEEKCRFLSNFSAQTAEVEIPGEFLMPKPTHYYIKIAR